MSLLKPWLEKCWSRRGDPFVFGRGDKMLPDTGERYLSTFLFEAVNEGSDEIG